ncbi:MAG: phosphate uptake regulator PhoU [Nitrososphaerales archaeon]|jgi:phosphate uptake regulator
MNESRRLQKVSHSTLTVSIPAEQVKHLGLKEGDNVMVKEEVDGTLRLIPTVRKPKMVKASIRVDAVDTEELLSRLVVGCYMLGYDAIELTSKNGISPAYLAGVTRTLRSLRGVEIVQSSENGLLAQSFMDPAKFPVDSLIKRLQLLVSASLEHSIEALRTGSPSVLDEIRKIQEEIDALYWLIVRQLLVALGDREISVKIGLESPLHTSGDRVSAKTIEEIGRIILELTEETVNSKEAGKRIEGRTMKRIEDLARSANDSFEATIESLLAPEIRTIDKALAKIEATLSLEREVTLELSESAQSHMRTIVAHFGQLARYCSIIIEIALNRLLRKTSRICVITSQ